MDIYKEFDEILGNCQKCKTILSKRKIEPRPIVSGIKKKPVMLIGQAPGITEYELGKPFSGQAGKGIRKVFEDIGVSNFDETIWSSAIVKCFPGKEESGNGDKKPCTEMVSNCQPFLLRQIELSEPKIIVTLGGFPLKTYLRIQGRGVSNGKSKLEYFVGKKETWNGKTIIFFPHTSGISTWLKNSEENNALFNDAQNLLKNELINLGIINT